MRTAFVCRLLNGREAGIVPLFKQAAGDVFDHHTPGYTSAPEYSIATIVFRRTRERERETFIREKRRPTEGRSSIEAAVYAIIIK